MEIWIKIKVIYFKSVFPFILLGFEDNILKLSVGIGAYFRLKIPFSCKPSGWILIALVPGKFFLSHLQGHIENYSRNICLSLQWESEDSDERTNVQSLAVLFSILLDLSWSVVPIMLHALVPVRSSPSLLLFRDFTVCLKVHQVNALCSEKRRNEDVKTFQ